MDAITKEMVKLYKIKKIGLDFMGYRVDKTNNISFHHLIIPNRLGGKREISNGAILMQGQHRGNKGKLLIKPQYLIRPKLDTF